MNFKNLLKTAINASVKGGHAIMEVYASDFAVEHKDDKSPLTLADKNCNEIIERFLMKTNIPILSEEGAKVPFSERKNWEYSWLVDPLDGTKEFINRNGEFTVNIALIEKGVPVLGVVYVPVLGITYAGIIGQGAWKYEGDAKKSIQTRSIQSLKADQRPVEVVASRNHGAEEVVALMARIDAELGEVATKNMGSSLKLCLVAEGEADLYPRLALTSEWDTAAAQAVVEAAGGKVIDSNFDVLRYNTKENILNPFFYVIGDVSFDWERLLQQD